MLPPDARLRSGRDIRAVTRCGLRRGTSGITVHLLPAAGSPTGPLATVLVGRPAGGAVQRNRLRRRVRHSLLRVWSDLAPGDRLVVRAAPPADCLSAAELDAALRGALRRAAPRSRR
jgi:ribonuclease P protein component